MYNNGTQFNFVKGAVGVINTKLGETLKRLNQILYGVVEAKPYTFDWDYILKEYEATCAGGDIDEFCSSFVHGYAMMNNFLSDHAIKEAMYVELRANLIAKRVSGEIA